MAKYRTGWKVAFITILSIAGILVGSLSTAAAAKPYEYTFEKDTAKFNKIGYINKLIVSMDEQISELKDWDDNIYVVQADQRSAAPVNIIKSIGKVGTDQLTITFKNLELIDYAGILDYQLVINKETLRFDQLEDYVIPFQIYDILPGFKSTFIDTDADILNEHVYMNNANRDIFVHVPKIFISSIETIHHYEGILPEDSNEDDDISKDPISETDVENPALTNIDVYADEEATRLKVAFGDSPNLHSRDLLRRADMDGFSMGQAGIDDITNRQSESETEFSLRAFNDDGRFLEERRFKLRVKDPDDDFIISDYLPEPTDEFGESYSLYDLMADPEMLENIVSRIPVSQLDSLGVTYTVGNTSVTVADEEQLLIALNNPKVKTIKLPKTLTLQKDLVIDRNVTIEGYSAVTPTDLKGYDVRLSGPDITVRLNNLSIDNDLLVDVGANGTAILDNVAVKGNAVSTEIISGGKNSIHLYKFKTDKLVINNSSELRVVVNGELKKASDETFNTDVIIKGVAPVTLEGKYQKVNVQSSITLNMTEDTDISTIDIATGQTLRIMGTGSISTSIVGEGDVVFPDGEGTSVEREFTYDDEGKTLEFITNEVQITLDLENFVEQDCTEETCVDSIPSDINWQVINGSEDHISITKDIRNVYKLVIDNTVTDLNEIILQGVHYQLDGEVKHKTVYTVTIPVSISK
ncbi:hypothetical protein [Bacillus dakarensis]|uniref:hypothetical protein n=1 Tax=Robertmurraya dakarensis TaxID=1926278 RepID=UPI00098262E7|nr:hypothetical protein [Bacillus dakarensis]